MAEVVLYEKLEGGVALVTLNRPEKRNAVNGALASAVDAAVKRSEADPEIGAVVLTSSTDEIFCAGADLAEVSAGGTGMATPDGGFAGIIDAKRTKPWIAATKGATLAGGLEICLALDMIVAADNCRFGLPEVKRGLVAVAGGVTRMPKIVPLPVAIEMVATGEPISAQRAYEVGLVNRVVPLAEVVDTAVALARAIAANAPLAVRESVRIARRAVTLSDEEVKPVAAEIMPLIMGSEDVREGMQAFLEKRKPRWVGR